jgi:DNA-binding MarR family transcriptional regulator
MPHLMLKDLPRYECLLEGAKKYPELNPSACEAYLNLLRTGDDVVSVVDKSLADHQISSGRFGVLMLLWNTSKRSHDCSEGEHKGPRTPAELAEAAGVSRATMTGLIDTLERDDFVRRKPDPHDRRMMSVELTDEGNAFLNRMLPGHFHLIAELMEPLSESERKTLVSLLNKILQRSSHGST